MMATDNVERADEAAVAPTIAQAAFDPALAIAKEFQQQIEDFDGVSRIARTHEITPPHPSDMRVYRPRMSSVLFLILRQE
jgi:hypothetical protein